MEYKYLIFGGGFIGKKLNEFLDKSIISKDRVIDLKSSISEIERYSPEVVINCIGKTGTPHIDWCEENKSETFQSNVLAPLILGEACHKTRKKMVHIGSGCIYEGNNKGVGFSEEDEPNYVGSFYSETKVISESLLKKFDVLQIRIRMPIDSKPSKRNLITKLLGYDKMISIPNSVTILEDFLDIALKLIEKNQTGIFNVVNKGEITHGEIIEEYNKLSEKKHNYKLISLDDLHEMTKARRSNCILSIKKLEGLGIEVPQIKESLRKCMQKYVKEQQH